MLKIKSWMNRFYSQNRPYLFQDYAQYILAKAFKRLKVFAFFLFFIFSSIVIGQVNSILNVSNGISEGNGILITHSIGEPLIDEYSNVIAISEGFLAQIEQTIISQTNVEELDKLVVFPNPGYDFVKLENIFCNDLKIILIDQGGKRANCAHLQNGVLNVSCLNKGLYVLRIFCSEIVVKDFKFIKI